MRKFQQKLVCQHIDNGTGGYHNGIRFIPYPEDHFIPYTCKSSFATAMSALENTKDAIYGGSTFYYVLEASVTDKETGEVIYKYTKQ